MHEIIGVSEDMALAPLDLAHVIAAGTFAFRGFYALDVADAGAVRHPRGRVPHMPPSAVRDRSSAKIRCRAEGRTSVAQSIEAERKAAAFAKTSRPQQGKGLPGQCASATICDVAQCATRIGEVAPEPPTRHRSYHLAKPARFAYEAREWYRSISFNPR